MSDTYGKKRLGWRKKLLLGWGKIRRFLLYTLNPDYIKRQHAKRQGDCARCGVCCNLMLKCPSLESQSDNGACSACKIHKKRPPNCSIFPVDEKDMRDRDLVSDGTKCGYSFPKEKKK